MKQLKQFDIVAILKPLNSEILQREFSVTRKKEPGTQWKTICKQTSQAKPKFKTKY